MSPAMARSIQQAIRRVCPDYERAPEVVPGRADEAALRRATPGSG